MMVFAKLPNPPEALLEKALSLYKIFGQFFWSSFWPLEWYFVYLSKNTCTYIVWIILLCGTCVHQVK